MKFWNLNVEVKDKYYRNEHQEAGDEDPKEFSGTVQKVLTRPDAA